MPRDGEITSRKRALPFKVRGGKLRKTYVRRTDGKVFIDSFTAQPISITALQGSQVTVSENHSSAWRKRRSRPFMDIGGEFSSLRQYVKVIPDEPRKFTTSAAIVPGGDWSSITEVYSGEVLPTLPNGFPPFANSGKSGLLAWGTKAVALSKPTNPVADASIFLSELLREGLPRPSGIQTWEEKTRAVRDLRKTGKLAGSEYLNVEFGWKPIANDINKFAEAVCNADRVLDQFRRDSGRLVRRTWSFEPLRTVVLQSTLSNVSPWTNPGISNLDGANKGKVIVTRETTIRRWFSGAFTYHVPLGNTVRDRMARQVQEAKKLLGVSLTPETVYNLTPWSWAVDWFTNTGDIISNLSDWAVDCLVLKYGYIMEHTMNRDIYTFSGPTGFAGASVRPGTIEVVSETKLRYEATPFGFGLTWNGFSPRQLAIAAALGITRS